MKMAVVGAGYWGPNLMRNVSHTEGCELGWICDLDGDLARRAARHHPGVDVTDDLDDLLDDRELVAVALATPAGTHADLALRLMEAGKHLLVEKPLATSVAEGRKLVERAEELGVVLMCDHTFCYTPAVRKIRDLIDDGTLGEIQFIDSVRVNLGLVQPDIDVLWDLAPHDLSIFDFVLPADRRPIAVAAQGADPIGANRMCVAYLTLQLPENALAHVHVNWLSPTKIRTTIVGGSRRTVVWDDNNPTQRLSVFDRGVELRTDADPDARRQRLVSYRTGDMVSPALEETEALGRVIAELRDAISERREPLTDGQAGLRVLQVLEGASRSVEEGGRMVAL